MLLVPGLGHPNVLVAIDVIESGSLQVARGIGPYFLCMVNIKLIEDNAATHLLSDRLQAISRHLSNADIVLSICDVHRIVVVDKNSKIVEALIQRRVALPLAGGIRRSEDVRLAEVDASIPVEQSVTLAVLQRACPDATNVRPFGAVQVVNSRRKSALVRSVR